jgi:hypothetical protein
MEEYQGNYNFIKNSISMHFTSPPLNINIFTIKWQHLKSKKTLPIITIGY